MPCAKTYNRFCGVTVQCNYCAMPFRVDLYRGCTHGCEYCFASQSISGKKLGVTDFFSCIETVPHEKLDSLFKQIKSDGKNFTWRVMLKNRQPLHIGGMSDPFQPCDEYERTSEAFLREIIKADRYPAVWSTKGRLVTRHTAALKDANSVVQISCIATKSLPLIEPGAPTFEERLAAARTLSSAGIPVILRVQPVIISLWDEMIDCVTQFCQAGIHGLVVEGIKKGPQLKEMPGTSIAIGKDFIEHLKTIGQRKGNELAYNMRSKLRYALAVREIARQHKVEFYVGDNDLRQLGDGPNCCGVGNLPGYDRYHKAQVSPLLFQREFSFEDLPANDPVMMSYNDNGGTDKSARKKWKRESHFKDILRGFFNRNEGNCVLSTCGGIKAIGLTPNKNVIYRVMTEAELIEHYKP